MIVEVPYPFTQVIRERHSEPINDLRPHLHTVHCWCRPVEDDVAPDFWLHQPMDRREDYGGREDLH